jgi:hypothetical protein
MSGEQPLDIDEEDLPLASEITTADFHVLLEQVQQSHRQKEEFVRQLPMCANSLDQPFGKDNKPKFYGSRITCLHQNFLSEKDVCLLCSTCSQANQLTT